MNPKTEYESKGATSWNYETLKTNYESNNNGKSNNLEDRIFLQVIEESLKSKQRESVRFLDELMKDKENENDYVGIVNLGNTCYFSCLLQILLFCNSFSELILTKNFKSRQNILENLEKEQQVETEEQKSKRVFNQYSVNLVLELQKLFGLMLYGNQNRVNPEKLLGFIMERGSNKVFEIGLQRDIVEILGVFFDSLDNGFQILTNETDEGGLKQEAESKEKLQNVKVFQGLLNSILLEEKTMEEISVQEKTFEYIDLQLKDGEILKAWEKSWNTRIENYKINSQKSSSVYKKELCNDLPNLLLFQVNRIEFKEGYQMIKNNTHFFFEKEIYIDQFLEKNKKEIIQNKEKASLLDDQVDEQLGQIAKLDNYFGFNKSISGNLLIKR